MAVYAAKHYAHKVSLGDIRDTTLAVEVISQVVGKFLQGGVTGNYITLVVNKSPFGINGK